MNIKTYLVSIYKRFVFNLSAMNSPFLIGFYKYLYSPKKGSLSDFLNLYSKNTEDLIFIQIGANDGFNNDPLHTYIKRDNWSGILLEPQKLVFEKYLKRLHAKSKTLHLLNAAIGDSDGYQSIYKIGFSEARWATGLASFNKNVLQKAFASGYVHQQAKKEGIVVPKEKAKQIVEEKIRVISFGSIIQKYGVDKLDLLAIDTEGFDFEVIKMIDFQILNPSVIVFESIHLSPTDKELCFAYLKKHGYKLWDEGINVVAMKNPTALYQDFF